MRRIVQNFSKTWQTPAQRFVRQVQQVLCVVIARWWSGLLVGNEGSRGFVTLKDSH